ncbi:TonB-dependent receptor [Urechidicola vernalis]|uniref:TonB-dependent receptor n=1 Tax=Urechidicola vernalis TaxID=3075600 RepID=A0ABU2Y3H9_9FLAO|nr:TonB-dependent receptor [Urechidicola sp. P050]MDT0552757.1 TonB-dependent receptor [Urechidicola sp. P050]
MKKSISFSILSIISLSFFAQEKAKDTLKTDEIIVVKPYTPTISAAYKIKTNPKLDPTQNEKETINYSFFSVPVASTFTPTKGTAQSVVREPLEKVYENFVAAGFGNYGTPYLEVFIHSNSHQYNDFGAFIKHQSSSGGIDGILVDDGYSDSEINLYYKQFERYYNWEFIAGAQHNVQNWYGLPNDIIYNQTFLDALDPKQTYLNIFAEGNIDFDDAIFSHGTFNLNHFSDKYGSGELHAYVAPTFEFPLSTDLFTTDASLEFLSSQFDNAYGLIGAVKNSFLNLGVMPTFQVLREDYSLDIGAKVYYSFDLENSNNKFYFYPDVTFSYKLMDETVIAFAGVTGDLEQNSYQKLTEENPFVSPTLNLLQTDQQYNAFIGAKGKLSSTVSYNITGSYKNENNKAQFMSNQALTDATIPVNENYEAGNSFDVVYDDISTINITAELSVDLSKEFNFGGNISYNNYSPTNFEEVWNLPDFTSTLFAKYNAKNWYIGTDLYFVGERKDFIMPFIGIDTVKTLDAYVDLNFNAGYEFSDRLTAFAKLNNVLSDNYERYSNFEVQGFQVLAGVIYKFDF